MSLQTFLEIQPLLASIGLHSVKDVLQNFVSFCASLPIEDGKAPATAFENTRKFGQVVRLAAAKNPAADAVHQWVGKFVQYHGRTTTVFFTDIDEIVQAPAETRPPAQKSLGMLATISCIEKGKAASIRTPSSRRMPEAKSCCGACTARTHRLQVPANEGGS